jgi:hypothetical protein
LTLFYAATLASVSFLVGWCVGHRQYKREVKAMAGTLDRLAVTGAIKQ